jgi:hypothetical protein
MSGRFAPTPVVLSEKRPALKPAPIFITSPRAMRRDR